MYRDHRPGERGAVVRYSGPVASRAAIRLCARTALVAAGLLSAFAGFVPAQQDPPATDDAAAAEVTPPRRAANIQWNPKTTPEEIKQFKRTVITEFDPATRSNSLTDAQRETLTKFIRHAIYMLTVEQEVDNFPKIIEQKILAPIDGPTTTDAAKKAMRNEVLKAAEELLFEDTQPPIVQYNVVVLVASLNEDPADNSRRPPVPAVPYLDSYKLLVRVLKDPKFPIHCRLAAAFGLERLLRDGPVESYRRSEIGLELVAVLAEPIVHPIAKKWLRLRAIDAIGQTGRVSDVGNNPVFLDALMKTVADPQEDWEVRANAARRVTQLQFDGQTNVELVNHEIGKLVYDLGTAYNASKNRKASQWRWSIASTYLAYRSRTEEDQKVRHWGLLFQQVPRGKAQVDGAFKVMAPIFKLMLEANAGPNVAAPPPVIPDAQLKALADWLAKNKPTDRKPYATSPEELKEVPPSKPDAASAGNPEPDVTDSSKES
jgi:hypothetical protein